MRYLVISQTEEESHFDIVIENDEVSAINKVSSIRLIPIKQITTLNKFEVNKINLAMITKTDYQLTKKFKENTNAINS